MVQKLSETQSQLELDSDWSWKVETHNKRLKDTHKLRAETAIITCALCNAVNQQTRLQMSWTYATLENIRPDVLPSQSIIQ